MKFIFFWDETHKMSYNIGVIHFKIKMTLVYIVEGYKNNINKKEVLMNINQLKSLQIFYSEALARHATLRAPSEYMQQQQDILFAMYEKITYSLSKLL